VIRVLGLSLYGPQAASHRVRLSQIQSLLDNAYLQRSFSGRRPSLRALLAACGRRLQALHQADHLMAAAVAAHACEYCCTMA
jgi:hypothetical protein